MFNIFRAIRRARTTTPITINTASVPVTTTPTRVDILRAQLERDGKNPNDLYYPYNIFSIEKVSAREHNARLIAYNEDCDYRAIAACDPAYIDTPIVAFGPTPNAAMSNLKSRLEAEINHDDGYYAEERLNNRRANHVQA